ncbi:ATP10 protein-domain-containing protein [Tuber brumale]|nr:ATP10 protein-domain-containing protein [Tuber brumale]
MNPALRLHPLLLRPHLHFSSRNLNARQSSLLLHLVLRSTYSTTVPTPPIPTPPPPKPNRDHPPPPLDRPIGLPYPPEPLPPSPNTSATGKNGFRTLSQIYTDLSDPGRNLAKRRYLTRELAKPYFRDISRLSIADKGKSFVAPQRLFKREHALWFPNLNGRTLVAAGKDTTDVLRGRVSIVAVFSGTWAERQVGLWGLDEVAGMVREAGGEEGVVGRMDINIEENLLRYWIVMVFRGSLRRRMEESRWGRYFIVKEGLDDETRDQMGYHNSKVGYVYLLDEECRIRWAGSGPPIAEERAALIRGFKKLVADSKRKPGEVRAGGREGEGVNMGKT